MFYLRKEYDMRVAVLVLGAVLCWFRDRLALAGSVTPG
jgi:hypothetical protein